jgi:radical SAM protein with 4Fe4S-binding SPASM domain
MIFGINPSGHVLPCVLMDPEECTFGHIGDDPKSWITAGLKWKKSRPQRAECESCSDYNLCGGGCPAILPICGSDECDIVRKNCEVARMIFEHFRSRPESLLGMVGIT